MASGVARSTNPGQPMPGTVTATSPQLMVQVHGSSSGAPAYNLGSYTPTIGDVVAVVPYRQGHLVLGEEVAPT